MSKYLTPPIRRYRGNRVDAHVHIRPPEQMTTLLEMADAYSVRTFVGIADLEVIAACRRALPGQIHGMLRLTYDDIDDTASFRRRTLDLLHRGIEEEGIRGVKFWFKPEFNARDGLYWDDPRLDHIFDVMCEHRLVALIHIADPDIWFEQHYTDVGRYLSKRDNYRQLENRMDRHTDLLVQAAHLGGDPEDLPHLDAMLDRHPNLHYDLSATKWLARELSAKPEASREFIARRADRLLWGSDLVVGRRDDMTMDDYATRYYVHSHLWEGRGEIISPIPDNDAGRPVTVVGLDLSDDVLAKIYCRNAERLYRMSAAR
jgi:predicted TIM-barrel fold metal-dependent hydrolase